tara:strand:+ start:1477 stop:1782 length:306 start_codon:yes stop_codon:yes gene_type:complete
MCNGFTERTCGQRNPLQFKASLTQYKVFAAIFALSILCLAVTTRVAHDTRAAIILATTKDIQIEFAFFGKRPIPRIELEVTFFGIIVCNVGFDASLSELHE